jgi:hypothetical protein
VNSSLTVRGHFLSQDLYPFIAFPLPFPAYLSREGEDHLSRAARLGANGKGDGWIPDGIFSGIQVQESCQREILGRHKRVPAIDQDKAFIRQDCLKGDRLYNNILRSQ